MLFRTYRIVVGGRTAMVIMEQFPFSIDDVGFARGRIEVTGAPPEATKGRR